MKRVFVWCFVFVLAASFVLAADEWGEINSEVSGVDDELVDVEEFEVYAEDDYVPVVEEMPQSSGDGKFYTTDFYIALGVGVGVLVALGVVVWLFLRGPKNKWEK